MEDSLLVRKLYDENDFENLDFDFDGYVNFLNISDLVLLH